MDIIAKHIRAVPDFPKPGIMFRDITPLLESPEAFRHTIDVLQARYADWKLDRILAIEARGFLFGAALADRLGVGLAVVRKPGKLPYKTVRKEYTLEYGSDAIEMHEDALPAGARIIIIDDLLATGGTAGAAAALARECGAEVLECAFVIELDGLGGRDRLGDVPCHSLVTYSE